jgi:hypothetical protein
MYAQREFQGQDVDSSSDHAHQAPGSEGFGDQAKLN